MGIHRNYVNKKTHSSIFIVTNFELWVYTEIMWIKRHIVPFLYSYKFKIWVYKGIFFFYVYPYLIICNYKKGTMHIFIHVVPFL